MLPLENTINESKHILMNTIKYVHHIIFIIFIDIKINNKKNHLGTFRF